MNSVVPFTPELPVDCGRHYGVFYILPAVGLAHRVAMLNLKELRGIKRFQHHNSERNTVKQELSRESGTSSKQIMMTQITS